MANDKIRAMQLMRGQDPRGRLRWESKRRLDGSEDMTQPPAYVVVSSEKPQEEGFHVVRIHRKLSVTQARIAGVDHPTDIRGIELE